MKKLTVKQIAKFKKVVPEGTAKRARFFKVRFLWADGVTFGRFIFLRRGLEFSTEKLVAHELVHSLQFKDAGTVPFMYRYIKSYLTGLKVYRNHYEAYMAIPQEVEARRKAALVSSE